MDVGIIICLKDMTEEAPLVMALPIYTLKKI